MIYWTIYAVVKTIFFVFFQPKVLGRENLPAFGGFIFAGNHVSNLDPFILGITLTRQTRFLAKDSLFKTKFRNWLFRSMGAFPIKRNASDYGALRTALRIIKSGFPLVLFPEGTRGVSGKEKKSQPGIGFIAAQSGCPVVPVFLEGTDKALPPGKKWFRFHKVRVHIGKPLFFSKGEDYNVISDKIMNQISFLSNS